MHLRRLLAVLLLCCLSNISAQSTVNKNFKMPKNIKSYSEYLKYAGMATGALPIEPLAEEVSAEGPSAGAQKTTEKGTVKRTCCEGSALLALDMQLCM